MNFQGYESAQSDPGCSELSNELLPGIIHPLFPPPPVDGVFFPLPIDDGGFIPGLFSHPFVWPRREILPRFSHPGSPWPVDIGDPIPIRGDCRTIDDCVVDYPPTTAGSCRIYKVCSSGTKCNLGSPFGITYIFVQGKDSACLVTSDIWDTKMSPRLYEEILMSLADPCFGGAPTFKYGDLDQFAVVSVILDPDAVSMIVPHDELNKEIVFDEVSGSYGNQAAINLVKESSGSLEKRTIHFLKKVMEKDNPLILAKIVETAISALQYLHNKKFQANEIKVCVAGEQGRFKLLLPEAAVVPYLEGINKS